MEHLRYALNTYAEVAWLLKQDYFMYVSDVEDAFLLLPLAPWLWFFMLFRFYLNDDDDQQTTCVHLFGDFGTSGMPGTFYIFFVKVVVQMGRSEMVLTLPMAIYVDDCGIIGPVKPPTKGRKDQYHLRVRRLRNIPVFETTRATDTLAIQVPQPRARDVGATERWSSARSMQWS